MQKAHDLWEGFNTFSRLLRGYYRAARGKADRESVLNFHRNLEANLFALREELENGTYQWGPYRSFWVEDPKRRMIEAAPFRDRVVH